MTGFIGNITLVHALTGFITVVGLWEMAQAISQLSQRQRVPVQYYPSSYGVNHARN